MDLKIAITGHRPNKLGNDYDLTSPLVLAIKTKIIDYIEGLILHNELHGVILNPTFITGMALGIDTLFALIAIELKRPFLAAIPCWGQDSKWPNRSRSRYVEIINNPLCVQKFIHDGYYTPTCMQERNEWMVNECDLLIAVWDGSSGGTANCVKYAQSIGKELIIINPTTI